MLLIFAMVLPQVDGSLYIVCLGTSPTVYEKLPEGKHQVTVRAFCMDAKGNSSTVRKKFRFRTC